MEERDREAAVLRETPGADAEARVLVMTDGADRIRTTFPDFYDFFRLRGFEAAESHMEAPMSAIVHYT